jgi:hypothetical protein
MISGFILSQHPIDRMHEWEIPEEMIIATLQRPEGRIYDMDGQYFYQRIIPWSNGRKHLLRILVDETQVPIKVITLYHSSRYGRYTR